MLLFFSTCFFVLVRICPNTVYVRNKQIRQKNTDMASNFQKISGTVTGVLISVITQINAVGTNGSPRTPKLSSSKPTKNPSSCCAAKCRPSPYYGPNCIPEPYCQEVNVRGELLYWTASLGGL